MGRNSTTIFKKNLYYGVLLTLCALFFMPFETLFAASSEHAKNPCAEIPGNGGGGKDTKPGTDDIPGGEYVPVRDFNVEKNVDIIGDNTYATSYYLRILCDKEYDKDPVLQHQWAMTVDSFVERVINWIANAYGPNSPAFVVNPYVYYKKVAFGINIAMVDEITKMRDDEKLDPKFADFLINSIQAKRLDRIFPDLAGNELPQETADNLAKNMSACEKVKHPTDPQEEEICGWALHRQLTLNPVNNPEGLYDIAMSELEQRQQTAIDIEKQKLDWGRGYYSQEACGQLVFSGDKLDVRTCRTLTPGSTLQDLTSLVLGASMRQMENADEYEEWISQSAFYRLNRVFSTGGLFIDWVLPGFKGQNPGPGAINPNDAEKVIRQVETESTNDEKNLKENELLPRWRVGIFEDNENMSNTGNGRVNDASGPRF